MKKFLGIIGGIGPEASAYLYNRIVLKTKVLKDQDHIDMVIFNHASIPDRTSYLLDNNCENPLPYLIDDVVKLNDLGASLIVIPCNTSLYFYNELQKNSKVPILNMIDDTVLHLKQLGYKKVGILATTGTIKMHLYQDACLKYGLDYYILKDDNQTAIMNIIYKNIKVGQPIDTDKFKLIINEMLDEKVEAIILGCTELSILKSKLKLNKFYVDPLDIEIKKILTFYNKEIKEEELWK